jgi:hypothetical protein
MSEAEFIIFRSLNTHQVLIIVVDTRILGCVADSLQQRRFAGISPTDYKDAKSSIFGSEVIWIKVAHGRGRGKERLRGRECRPHVCSGGSVAVISETEFRQRIKSESKNTLCKTRMSNPR